ncbi:hypothetical protein ABBQ38_003364 [Trebouxia sp. C0009 RCD-2024]
MTLTLQVKHGKSTHQVSVEQDAKVLEVMQLIEQVTEVPIRQQKLICQGKVLDSSSTVKGSNLKTGSRLMLMTAGGQTQGQSAVQQVIKEKAAAAQQRAELFKQKQSRTDNATPAMTVQGFALGCGGHCVAT